MLPRVETTISDGLEKGLEELRSKLELLPPDQQGQFRLMIDAAGQQCRRLPRQCAALRDAVDDLRLAAKGAQFDIEASCREIEQARRQNGLEPLT